MTRNEFIKTVTDYKQLFKFLSDNDFSQPLNAYHVFGRFDGETTHFYLCDDEYPNGIKREVTNDMVFFAVFKDYVEVEATYNDIFEFDQPDWDLLEVNDDASSNDGR